MAQKNKKTGDYNELLFDLLRDPEEAQEYLNAALEDGDARVFLLALRNVAQAYGMTEIAKKTKLDRASLYRALSATGNPSLSSLVGILGAIGLLLQVGSQVVESKPQRAGAASLYTTARFGLGYGNYVHAGIEGKDLEDVPQTEYSFVGQARNQECALAA